MNYLSAGDISISLNKYSVFTLTDKIKEGAIVFSPTFTPQWDSIYQSRYIESITLPYNNKPH